MSASKNAQAVSNQGGEFSSKVAPSQPLETKGHQPGYLYSDKDRAPEFHAQQVPDGTAPRERTFKPNPPAEYRPSDANTEDVSIAASDNLGGFDSAQVRQGVLGQPAQGQTSAERHHDGKSGRKHEGQGLQGLVSGVANKGAAVSGHDPDMTSQRGLDNDDAAMNAGSRGTVGGPAAEERLPVSGEELADERE